MSQTCEFVEQRMSEYIDGELNEIEKEFVRHHTAHCPKCMQILNEFKILDWNLRFEDSIAVPHEELRQLRTQTLDHIFKNKAVQPVDQAINMNKLRPYPATQKKIQTRNVFQNTVRNATKFIDYIPGNQLGNLLVKQTSGLLYQTAKKSLASNFLNKKAFIR